MCHTYVVISENAFNEMLSNSHELVSVVGTVCALGGKSAEYVFGIMKLM